MWPIGTKIQEQHWIIPRENAWETLIVIGPPKRYGPDNLYPVRTPDGYEYEANLDACAHVRAAI